MEGHWKPWRGDDYNSSRLLLLGESAYSWDDKKGGFIHPSPRHPIDMVEELLSGTWQRFTGMLTRGLAGCQSPMPEQVARAWAGVAFTNFVPGTVGPGRESRPTTEHWKRGHDLFPGMLADLAPRTVIVMGKMIWNNMPETDFYVTELVQAYRLPGGGEAMCWVVDHPARGLSAEKLSRVIAYAHRRELLPSWRDTVP